MVEALRDRFLGWQCRIRQIAMRQEGGRPSSGMRPRVAARSGAEIAAALTVLLVPREPAESTAFFRFQVQKSADPRDVYDRGLAFLQAEYFQQPESFGDVLAAVLPSDSAVAVALTAAGVCVLEFDQWRQAFRLPCTVVLLAERDPVREAALWHNRIFNPALPDSVHVLTFQLDWRAATAAP